jgi:hypothetical protein
MSWVRGYFEIRQLNARASPNPYYRGGSGRGAGKLAAALGLAGLVAGLLWLFM